MALDKSIATQFGDILAGTCSYATWDLTSSLLGHFVDYDVSYTHLTSYGNPDLSLLDQVTIHELIHSATVDIAGKPYRHGLLMTKRIVTMNQTTSISRMVRTKNSQFSPMLPSLRKLRVRRTAIESPSRYLRRNGSTHQLPTQRVNMRSYCLSSTRHPARNSLLIISGQQNIQCKTVSTQWKTSASIC